MNVHLQHHCWEKAHFLFLQSRPSPMRHQGGGTGCAPFVVSGGGQLSSSHACWDASCFKTITSPSCYYTQLGRKMHPFGNYWHHLDIKFSVIWFSICFLPSLLTEAQLQTALTRSAQKSTFGVGIAGDGALWWRLMRKVMSWVQIAWFASKMICIEVFNPTQKCQERKDFHKAVLGALKNTIVSSFSSDMEHSLSWRQSVILFFCIIYSECT